MAARRDELGLKQRDVAARIKPLVPPTMAPEPQRVSDWENGRNFPSDRYKSAIVTALEVEQLGGFGYFLIEEPEPERGPTPDAIGAMQEPTIDIAALSAQLDRIEGLLIKALSREVKRPKRVGRAIPPAALVHKPEDPEPTQQSRRQAQNRGAQDNGGESPE